MQELNAFVPDRESDIHQWSEDRTQAERLASSAARQIWRSHHSSGDLVIKQFAPERFRDRAVKEAENLRKLATLSIPCPTVIAVGRDTAGSYIITEWIPDSQTLGDRLASSTDRRPLLRSLADLLCQMHEAGFEHQDLHVGNILTRGDQLWVLDVHRARFGRPITGSKQKDNIAFLLMSFAGLVTTTDLIRFLHACGIAEHDDIQDVRARLRKIRHRHFKHRAERCTGKGSGFYIEGEWVLRDRISTEDVHTLLENPNLITAKASRRESMKHDGNGRFIKRTTPARAKKIWKNAHAILARRVDTPRLDAWGPGWVIGEWLDADHLYGWINAHFDSMGRVERDRFLMRLARTVRRMHLRGIFHKDLKAANVLVHQDRFLLTDLDRVKFSRDIADADRIFNLAQLNASLIPPLTRTDRLRFLHYYFAWEKTAWAKRSHWISEIMRISIERAHYWPPKD